MTEYTSANTITDMLRSILSTIIDRPAFLILSLMYEIFFNVANAELFNDSTIRRFYYKIQLILGVFMIFKLSISVLEAIVNPEKLTAKKTGTMSIIARVFISLALLAALTPINIPNPKNEYERKLKNNGLIFGILYSLQYRILQQNTLGRLVLGDEFVSSESSGQNKKIRGTVLSTSDAANSFSSTILKTFMRINLVPKSERQTNNDGKPDELNKNNWVCKDIDSTLIDTYRDVNADPQQLLMFINYDCDTSSSDGVVSHLKSKLNKLASKADYAFTYNPLGGIAAYVFAFLLLTFTVDVAIRAIKIAILRLIAPIPVISYMSPNPKDNGAMGTWAKSLATTYLSLFTRLLIIYLVIYLIQDMIQNGMAAKTTGGLIGGISFILICFGLFLFARQAPKFIQDALGIKAGSGSVGLALAASGLGTIRGGGKPRDAWSNMMEASRAAQSGGKDPVSGNSYRANLGSYKDMRDATVKKEKDKYDKNLAQNYYERALDIDDQDGAGYKSRRWWQSKDSGEARAKTQTFDANKQRYKANWQTHERATGRGVTTRAGSEFHTRRDPYPTPTPSGQQGTPPSGPPSRNRGDAADKSIGIEVRPVYKHKPIKVGGKTITVGEPEMRPNGGSGYAVGGSIPSGPIPGGPTPGRPTPGGPTPGGPTPGGPTPGGPTPDGPTPDGPTPGGPTPGGPTPGGPTPGGPTA